MSFTSASKELEHSRAVSKSSFWAVVNSLSRAISSIPWMPLSGVRSSWDMFARNSLFALVAASARSIDNCNSEVRSRIFSSNRS